MANKDMARVVIQMEAEQKRLRSDFDKAQKVVENSTQKMERASYRAAKGMEANMTRAASRVGIAAGGMASKLAGAFAAGASLRAATQLMDAATRIQNALKVAGLEGEQLQSVYSKLYDSAQRNAAPIEALVTLYSRLSLVQKELGVNQNELVTFSDNIALALRVGGTSAAEASGALLQLSQALGGGTVRAEEFTSVLEGAPTIVQAVAAGLEEAGGSVSKLRGLVNDGKVSSEAFFRAFEAGAVKLEQKVAGSTFTTAQRFEQLQNTLVKVAGELDTATGASGKLGGALDTLSGTVSALGGALVDIAESDIGVFIGKIVEAQGQVSNLVRIMGGIPGVLAKMSQMQVDIFNGKPLGTKMSEENIQSRIDGAFEGTGAAPKTGRLPADVKVDTVSTETYKPPASTKGGGGGRTKKGSGGGGAGADDYAREVESVKERTAALQAAFAAQSALNPLMADYSTELEKAEARQKLLAAAERQGKEITPALSAEIDELASSYAAATNAADKLAASHDDIRSAAEDALGGARDITKGLISDLSSSTTRADALKNALSALGDKLLDSGLDAFFGGGGKSGSGIFGALFSGLSGIGGGAAKADPWAGMRLAGGGRVSGPGSATSDSIPAMLSDGEHVTRAAMVRKYRPLLEAINSDRVPHLASGGLVAPRVHAPVAPRLNGRAPAAAVQSQPQPLNITIAGASGDPHVRELVRQGVSQALAEKGEQDRRGGFGTMQQRYTSQKG